MIFLFITLALFGSVLGFNSDGVYPVQREDYVWNGEPVAAPYHAYPARPSNVYRVSRQEFMPPLPYVGYYVQPRTEVWYPPLKNNYEHQIYQPSQMIPQTFSSNGYIPQLFVPASDQVFSSSRIPYPNIGHSSSRRPTSPRPSEATAEDNSVLSATRKSSIDEGEPLPPLSEYSKGANDRPVRKYVPFNDDVEINIEQKDLLKTPKPVYTEKRESDSQVERFRRQIMHIIEVPKDEEVVESTVVNSPPDQTKLPEPPLSFIDTFYRSGVRREDTALFLSDPEQYYKVMEERVYNERWDAPLQPKFFAPAPPEPSAETEEVIGEEKESSYPHWNPNPSVVDLPASPPSEDLFYHTPAETFPQYNPIDPDPSPTWDDDDDIIAHTFEENEERAVDTFSHIDVADVEKLFHARFDATEATEKTVTEESTTLRTPSLEEIINDITAINNDESSTPAPAEEEWDRVRLWKGVIRRIQTTTLPDEETDHPTEARLRLWQGVIRRIQTTTLPDEVTDHPTEARLPSSEEISTVTSNDGSSGLEEEVEQFRSWLDEELQHLGTISTLSDEVTDHPTETTVRVSASEEVFNTNNNEESSAPEEDWEKFRRRLEELQRTHTLSDEPETTVGVSSTEAIITTTSTNNHDRSSMDEERQKTLEKIYSWLGDELRRSTSTPIETWIDVTEATLNENEEGVHIISDETAVSKFFINAINALNLNSAEYPGYNSDAIEEERRVSDGDIGDVYDFLDK